MMAKRAEKSEMPNSSDSNHEAYKLGCAAFDAGRFSEAKSLFHEAIEFWPEDAQAWWALGNCHDELGNPKQAEKCFRKAKEYCDGKDKAGILFNLGNSLFDQHLFAEAVEIYLKIQKDSVIWTKAQRNLSLAQKEQA